MPISQNTLTMILGQVGDQDEQSLSPMVSVFWNARSDKDQIADGLRYQYTLRDTIDVLRGQVWQQVQQQEGDEQLHLEQKHKQLSAQYDDCEKEILLQESRASANRPPVVGQLCHKTPRRSGPLVELPRGPYPDPNDPAYRGDPLRVTTVPDTPQF